MGRSRLHAFQSFIDCKQIERPFLSQPKQTEDNPRIAVIHLDWRLCGRVIDKNRKCMTEKSRGIKIVAGALAKMAFWLFFSSDTSAFRLTKTCRSSNSEWKIFCRLDCRQRTGLTPSWTCISVSMPHGNRKVGPFDRRHRFCVSRFPDPPQTGFEMFWGAKSYLTSTPNCSNNISFGKVFQSMQDAACKT